MSYTPPKHTHMCQSQVVTCITTYTYKYCITLGLELHSPTLCGLYSGPRLITTSLSLYLSLSLSTSLPLYLPLSLPLYLSLYLSTSTSLPLYLSIFVMLGDITCLTIHAVVSWDGVFPQQHRLCWLAVFVIKCLI